MSPFPRQEGEPSPKKIKRAILGDLDMVMPTDCDDLLPLVDVQGASSVQCTAHHHPFATRRKQVSHTGVRGSSLGIAESGQPRQITIIHSRKKKGT